MSGISISKIVKNIKYHFSNMSARTLREIVIIFLALVISVILSIPDLLKDMEERKAYELKMEQQEKSLMGDETDKEH